MRFVITVFALYNLCLPCLRVRGLGFIELGAWISGVKCLEGLGPTESR